MARGDSEEELVQVLRFRFFKTHQKLYKSDREAYFEEEDEYVEMNLEKMLISA